MKSSINFASQAAFALSLSLISGLAAADASLVIEKRLSWDVIGLDSNNLAEGANVYAIGYRACNRGDQTAINVVSSLTWESANQYIDLSPGTAGTVNIGDLAVNQCFDSYYNVEVDRNDLARNTSKDYEVSFTATGIPTVTTPIEAGATRSSIYVEDLVSQNRNSIDSLVGPTTVYQRKGGVGG